MKIKNDAKFLFFASFFLHLYISDYQSFTRNQCMTKV